MIGKLSRRGLLVRTLVVRELKARYRASALGFLWSFLNPLVLLCVYALVFSYYLRNGTPDYAAFLASGLLPWIWFAASMNEGTCSIVSGSNLVNKALFPAEVLPLVSVVSNLAHFVLGLPILAGFLALYGRGMHLELLALPVLLAVQFAFTAALVLLLGTLNVFYRDVQHIVANVLTLWFFLTPVVYEAQHVPQEFAWTLKLNPMAHLVQGYQDIFFYGTLRPDFWTGLLGVAMLGALLAMAAWSVFSRSRDEFVEQV